MSLPCSPAPGSVPVRRPRASPPRRSPERGARDSVRPEADAPEPRTNRDVREPASQARDDRPGAMCPPGGWRPVTGTVIPPSTGGFVHPVGRVWPASSPSRARTRRVPVTSGAGTRREAAGGWRRVPARRYRYLPSAMRTGLRAVARCHRGVEIVDYSQELMGADGESVGRDACTPRCRAVSTPRGRRRDARTMTAGRIVAAARPGPHCRTRRSRRVDGGPAAASTPPVMSAHSARLRPGEVVPDRTAGRYRCSTVSDRPCSRPRAERGPRAGPGTPGPGPGGRPVPAGPRRGRPVHPWDELPVVGHMPRLAHRVRSTATGLSVTLRTRSPAVSRRLGRMSPPAVCALWFRTAETGSACCFACSGDSRSPSTTDRSCSARTGSWSSSRC